MIEQDLQSSLSKASTHVADSQTVDTLLAITQQIASMVSQGNEGCSICSATEQLVKSSGKPVILTTSQGRQTSGSGTLAGCMLSG